MKPSIQILVSCTNRKSVPVDNELQIRSIKAKKPEKRLQEWCSKLSRHRGKTIQAENLYAGEYWNEIKNIQLLAHEMGVPSKLWVMSAGYGLISADTCIYPYSATFANSEPDSVANGSQNNTAKSLSRHWWNNICGFQGGGKNRKTTITSLVNNNPKSDILIIASPSYLSAIEEDVYIALSKMQESTRLIVVTSSSRLTNGWLKDYSVCSSSKLLPALGGSCISLHARVAKLIINNINSWGFEATTINKNIRSLIAKTPLKETAKRQPMTDIELRKFIKLHLNSIPNTSCSKLLKILRTEGLACEQNRFKNIYWDIKGGIQ